MTTRRPFEDIELDRLTAEEELIADLRETRDRLLEKSLEASRAADRGEKPRKEALGVKRLLNRVWTELEKASQAASHRTSPNGVKERVEIIEVMLLVGVGDKEALEDELGYWRQKLALYGE